MRPDAPPKGQEKLVAWLRENPHRLHLGRISLAGVRREDITAIDQTLDLWTGVLTSRFRLSGERRSSNLLPSRSETCWLYASRAASRSTIAIDFPYGSPDVPAADWKSPDRHRTIVEAGMTLDSFAANSTPTAIGSASRPSREFLPAPATIASS